MMNFDKVNVEIVCPFCGQIHYVTADRKGFEVWQRGGLIQKALPDLTAGQREALISGMCPDCQSDIFGTEED